ncbi:tryptophan synthase subunit alpha [Papillibacter cinnamivorans]|uniref:Tryptophan synthase alpha chain n=1 Tax=Papillibacter cinnamivorans DSM 12816 TaxID=1122930 RepID=A0A1W2BBT6_9FIRM|nr:tryptophan synthase subunit alpha [Papillibacter cinnamivorans]SMC70304.1 tryptophan synthase, alpha chain [Papillibacter cinnamivorans DSM 12816]
MSRILKAFENGPAFIGFVTGGDPTLESSAGFIEAMADGGADLIEIGVPFSDPVAEGPVIQEANLRALKNGCTVDGIFGLVEAVRQKHQVPLVLLTYLNPVFHYGYERFFARCRETGADGVIIPDLPYEERGELSGIAAKNGVDVITMIAPTSASRIRMLAGEAKGFVYVVSSMGVTGVRSEIETDLESILAVVRDSTGTPAAVGFGISTPEQALRISRLADGVIVGSAIVKIAAQYGAGAAPHIREYVRTMKDAIRQGR